MTSKIKVDNINKVSDDSNIIKKCGTTITLGASGDSIALASGASQTGFGREGSVNWQTSIKTATFTAASGEGYFCNTSGGAFTVNLPSSPSVGDIVAIKDYGSSFATNSLTIGRGGSNLNGNAADSVRAIDNESLTMVYADATKGWLSVEEGTGFLGESFISATGGSITTSGDFKIHTFTGPGTFTVCKTSSTNNIVDYLVVAGGGGGGAGCGGGGGAGAGGFRFFATTPLNPQTGPGAPRNAYGSPSPSGTAVTVTAASFPITVGAGGTGGTVTGPSCGTCGVNGNTSVFSTITSAGGGGAGSGNTPAPQSTGSPGGSGGGNTRNRGSAGNGNTPPVTPPQGSNGGGNAPGPNSNGAGGGAAMAVGGNANPAYGGDGGAGAGIVGFGAGNGECSSCVQYFSGGGGGAVYRGCAATPTPNGTGGLGGGGAGALSSSLPAPQIAAGTAEAGTSNTGGGGGGGTETGGVDKPGGAGGSGVVVIRYKFQ
jgi:hypothetical protein